MLLTTLFFATPVIVISIALLIALIEQKSQLLAVFGGSKI
ncbi:hypothetical protein PTUN_b0867 [Pseudoalteromonas tunicata]|jgi:hypothetical protein|nr:hypothetical protein PTUN_b0867 [Pseudoalteromonas tunicata]